jgi:tetratricopeptide (TPR) repeat protein
MRGRWTIAIAGFLGFVLAASVAGGDSGDDSRVALPKLLDGSLKPGGRAQVVPRRAVEPDHDDREDRHHKGGTIIIVDDDDFRVRRRHDLDDHYRRHRHGFVPRYGVEVSLPYFYYRYGYGRPYYYYYPHAYVYYHYSVSQPSADSRRYVRLETSTVGQHRDGDKALLGPYGTGRYVTVEEEGGGRFESRLAPMLGGPGRVGALTALGESKLRAGEFAAAREAFQLAREADPEASAPAVGVALTLMAEGRYKGAAYMLRRGLEAVADLNALDLDLPELFGGPDAYSEVAARLREAAGDDSADGDLQLLLGFHHFGTRQYAEAASVLLAVQKADSSDHLVNGLLLAAERRLGAEDSEEDEPKDE